MVEQGAEGRVEGTLVVVQGAEGRVEGTLVVVQGAEVRVEAGTRAHSQFVVEGVEVPQTGARYGT